MGQRTRDCSPSRTPAGAWTRDLQYVPRDGQSRGSLPADAAPVLAPAPLRLVPALPRGQCEVAQHSSRRSSQTWRVAEPATCGRVAHDPAPETLSLRRAVGRGRLCAQRTASESTLAEVGRFLRRGQEAGLRRRWGARPATGPSVPGPSTVVMKTQRRLLVAHGRELQMTQQLELHRNRTRRPRADHPPRGRPRCCREAVARRDESGPVPAGTTAGAEGKEEAPAGPETLKKKRRSFPERRLPPAMLQKTRQEPVWEEDKHHGGEHGQMSGRLDRPGDREAGDVFVLARPRLAGGVRSRGVRGVSRRSRGLCSFSPSPAPGTGTQPGLCSCDLGSVSGGPQLGSTTEGPAPGAHVALRLPPGRAGDC